MEFETSADTREKAVRAFGFDEPDTASKLDRADFPSDEAFFDAVAMLEVRHSDPTYRAAYTKARREFNTRQREEAECAAQAAADEAYTARVKAYTLTPEQETQVTAQAAELAAQDLRAGRIRLEDFQEAVGKHRDELTREERERAVSTQMLNEATRAAMMQIRQGSR